MGREVFQIILDNQNGVYYPGQQVTGRLELQVKDDLKVTAIYLKFKGFANVHWTEEHGSGENRHTVSYNNHEEYFKHKICLLGKGLTGENTTKLKDDQLFTFPFNFQLPPGSPASYEAAIGQVRYFLKADINIPWAFDKHTKRMITVVNLLDLNTIPEAMNSGSKTDQKTLCCLCCESEPIIASVMVDRLGYVPGESIVFRSEIENKSNRDMKCTKAKLMMEVSYHATSKSNTVRNVLVKLRHGKIEGGGTDVWMNEKLHIPPVPPSYLQGCKIIDIRYYLTITVDPSGFGFDLNVPLEVIIGSIPLASVAQQHGITLPSAPPSYDSVLPPPGLGAPQGLYTDTMMPLNIPQATFSESALGPMSKKDDSDTEDGTAGPSNFAPVYTYYNWDKPDPGTTFSVEMTKK